MDFSQCFCNNINQFWLLLREIILDACHKFVTTRKIKKKSYPPWYTPHIVHPLNKVRTLRRSINSKRFPSSSALVKLKHLESNLLSNMMEAKEAYQFQLVSSYSKAPTTLFGHFSSMVSANSIPSTVHLNGTYESD